MLCDLFASWETEILPNGIAAHQTMCTFCKKCLHMIIQSGRMEKIASIRPTRCVVEGERWPYSGTDIHAHMVIIYPMGKNKRSQIRNIHCRRPLTTVTLIEDTLHRKHCCTSPPPCGGLWTLGWVACGFRIIESVECVKWLKSSAGITSTDNNEPSSELSVSDVYVNVRIDLIERS